LTLYLCSHMSFLFSCFVILMFHCYVDVDVDIAFM
jgi:hypothetical protein